MKPILSEKMEYFHENKIEKDILIMLEKVLSEDKDSNQSDSTLNLNQIHQNKRQQTEIYSNNTKILSIHKNYEIKPEMHQNRTINTVKIDDSQKIFKDYLNQNMMDTSKNIMNHLNNLELNHLNRSNIISNTVKIPSLNHITLNQFQKGQTCKVINNRVFNIDELIEAMLKFNDINFNNYYMLKGRFYMLLKNKNGSRILQSLIEKTKLQFLMEILQEIGKYLHELMCDIFANYFCQKFFSLLNEPLKIDFLLNIRPYLILISKNKIGTYSLRSIIEYVHTEKEIIFLVNSVNCKFFFDISLDSYGIHVAEKILNSIHEKYIGHIFSMIISNFHIFAFHANGIGVLKKALVNIKNEETISNFHHIIIGSFKKLIFNVYGNYVIQTCIEVWKGKYFNSIINCFINNFFEYSLNKFSSNVLEKCLEYGGDLVLSQFIIEISESAKISMLMENNFGNFVVQKALKLARNDNLFKIVSLIKSNINNLTKKRLSNKWKLIISPYENMNINNNNSTFAEYEGFEFIFNENVKNLNTMDNEN